MSFRRSVLFLLCLVAPCIAVGAERPNILFILTDDQGRQTLGCYGGDKVATPHIDSLARDGMLFTDAYVNPQCTPTRASFITGQHTFRNGMWHVIGWYGYPWAPIAEPAFVENLRRDTLNFPTLPTMLRMNGYSTGMAGKWHLTNNEDGNYAALKPEAGTAYGFNYVAPPGPGSNNEGDKWVDYLTDQTIGFIEKNRERPWFFYLAHHTVHHVLAAPEKLVEEFRAKGAPEEGPHSAVYLACVKHLDDSIGRLLVKLDEFGLRENTLVVFMSDNGGIDTTYDLRDFTKGKGGGLTKLRIGRQEFSNTPWRAGKGSQYEGGIRAPCLVRWPKVVQAGSRSETPVHVVDWLPTFGELAGAAPAKNVVVDGVSIVPLLKGGELAPRRLYWYLPFYELRWGATPCSVVREGDWKLIDYYGDSIDADGNYVAGAKLELFNLRNDSGERHDLAAEESARATSMRDQLRTYLVEQGAVIPAANPHYDPQRSLSETREKQPWNAP